MANKFRGTTWNNARFGPKIQIRRSIDLAELGDFGDITENSSDLPTSGATHRKATGGSTSATRGYTDLQGLFDTVVDTQDMGGVADATTLHRIWSSTGAITDIVTSAPTGILPVDQTVYELESTYAGGNSGNGNIFNVTNTGTDTVTITGLAQNFTATGENPGFTVKYKEGGYNSSGSNWVTAGVTGTFTPESSGTPTVLTFASDISITIEAGDTIGLHLETIGVMYRVTYTTGSSISNIVNSDDNLSIYEGQGLGFNGQTYTSRIWNGTIFYVMGDSSSSSQPAQAVIPMSDFSTNTLEHSIVNPIPSSSAMFGRNVALNDSYAIIGGSQINNAAAGAAGYNAGKAFIYNLSDGSVKYTLDNPNVFGAETHDQFGTSVDISNSYAIVGAQYEDTETVQDGTIEPGAAYIFDLSDGSLKYTLEHPDPYQWAVFGNKTAITDSYAAVGASANSAVANNSGSVYVYDVTDGSLLYTFNGGHEYGSFGSALEINGSYMIVGESNQDKVYVYDLTDGSLLYTFSDPVSLGNGFGFATAITDTHAIVSAPRYNNSLGAAHIYDLSDGSLLYTVENTNSVNESWAFFGRSVALNGSYAVVGANNEHANGVDQEGQAYVFDLSDGSLVDTIDHPNAVGTTQGDNFGYSVAINNTHVAVGAYREQGSDGSDGAGAVYIFSGQ
jgi:hypothetical protein